MTRKIRVGMLLMAACAWSSCALDAADECEDPARAGTAECAARELAHDGDGEPALGESNAALTSAHERGWAGFRLLTVVGRVRGDGGRVHATTSDPRARCHGGVCWALPGATITLTATPSTGYTFVAWSGCSASTQATLTLTNLSASAHCMAWFTACAPGARFDALGDLPLGDTASYATDLDATGTVVVGYSRAADGDTAVRWTPTEGLVSLGGPSSRAEGVSPDGLVIVGSIAKPDYELGRAAARFEPGAAPVVLTIPPPFPGPPAMFLVTDGLDATNAGDVYATCIQYGAYGEPLACRYHTNQELDLLGGSFVYAGDQAGSFAGTQLPERHGGAFASVAIYNGAQLGYPSDTTCLAPHGCRSEARAFSAAGGIVVGTALVPVAGSGAVINAPLFETGFVYTQADGMLRLADVAGGEAKSGAYAVSADGRVIGGFGTTDAGQRALLWIERAPTLLADALQAAGAAPPVGWTLLDVQAISADGRTYAGNARNAAGYPEAYRVVFSAVPSSAP